MIVYAGLLFILIINVIVPIVYLIINGSVPNGQLIELPEQFWWAWGSVVGVYGAGRSAEKLGLANKVTQAITGSNASKISRSAVG